MFTPPKLTMEQYLAFVDQIMSPPTVVTPPPAAKPVPQPALPPGPTQKEKDALVASLTTQKDTFPSMNPHSLSLPL